MSEPIRFHFDVDGENFSSAGEASVMVKKKLRQLGFSPDVMRRVSIAMYEGEINMVIHAHGGVADVIVGEDAIEIILADKGPGIPDIDKAMQEGYSTASDNIRALGFAAAAWQPFPHHKLPRGKPDIFRRIPSPPHPRSQCPSDGWRRWYVCSGQTSKYPPDGPR